jgi:hypothetical protein
VTYELGLKIQKGFGLIIGILYFLALSATALKIFKRCRRRFREMIFSSFDTV